MTLYSGLMNRRGSGSSFTLVDGRALKILNSRERLPQVVYGCADYIASKARVMGLKCAGMMPPWVARPDIRTNGLTTGDVIYATVMSLALPPGMAYWWIVRTGNGRIGSVIPLDPRYVTADDSEGYLKLTVNAGYYRQRFVGVRDLEIVVLRYATRPGRLIGFSPLDCADEVTKGAAAAETQAKTTFENAAIIPGVIQTQGELDREQAKLIRQQFRNRHRGPENNYDPIVLGRAEWKDVASTHVDAQFLETAQWTEAKIARQCYHLDPTLLGVPIQSSSLTYQNVAERDLAALKDGVSPYLAVMESGFTKLAPEAGICFDWESLLRPSMKDRVMIYKVMADIAVKMGRPPMTVDQMREYEGWPELTDEDLEKFNPTMHTEGWEPQVRELVEEVLMEMLSQVTRGQMTRAELPR